MNADNPSNTRLYLSDIRHAKKLYSHFFITYRLKTSALRVLPMILPDFLQSRIGKGKKKVGTHPNEERYCNTEEQTL